MILAAAQTNPNKGDISGNLKDHYRLTRMAADKGAALILFPEMSITGYERDGAEGLSFTHEDLRLDTLRNLAIDRHIIIIAGAPIRIHPSLYIGSFILLPDGSLSMYTKQFLHNGEEKFYQFSIDYNPVIESDNERLSLAICADIEHPSHLKRAKKAKTSIYAASIFYTSQGIPVAHGLLSRYAKRHSMVVLMSNFYGKTWNLNAGGRSACWNKNGELIVELDDHHSGLLIMEKTGDTWFGTTIKENY